MTKLMKTKFWNLDLNEKQSKVCKTTTKSRKILMTQTGSHVFVFQSSCLHVCARERERGLKKRGNEETKGWTRHFCALGRHLVFIL